MHVRSNLGTHFAPISGCCFGPIGWRFESGETEYWKQQSTWLSCSSRSRNPAAYMRPSTSTLLQNFASASLLCDAKGRVQVGRSLFFRHLFLLKLIYTFFTSHQSCVRDHWNVEAWWLFEFHCVYFIQNVVIHHMASDRIWWNVLHTYTVCMPFSVLCAIKIYCSIYSFKKKNRMLSCKHDLTCWCNCFENDSPFSPDLSQ